MQECFASWLKDVAVSIVSCVVCVTVSNVNDKVCTEELRSVGMSVMVVVVKVRLRFALAFNSSVLSICEAVRACSVISRGVCVATINRNV